MANNTVKIDELADAIEETLQSYAEDISDELHADVKAVTKQCVKDIKQGAPVKSGAYKKSWTSKVVFESREDIRTVVYAKAPGYRLAHLLENGHAKVNGGRVDGKPHIAPAEQKAEEDLVGKVTVGIKKL